MHYSQLADNNVARTFIKFEVYAVLEFNHGDRYIPCQLVLDSKGYDWESLADNSKLTDIPINIRTFNNKSKALDWAEYKKSRRQPPHWCL